MDNDVFERFITWPGAAIKLPDWLFADIPEGDRRTHLNLYVKYTFCELLFSNKLDTKSKPLSCFVSICATYCSSVWTISFTLYIIIRELKISCMQKIISYQLQVAVPSYSVQWLCSCHCLPVLLYKILSSGQFQPD